MKTPAEYEIENFSLSPDLGPDYMANFRPGWNFKTANRAEICCDCMTNFSPGWNISLGTKYEIAREASQENQNGAESTNRENRGIDSLVLSQFGLLAALNIQLFEMVTVYKIMELLKRNLSLAVYLSGRKTYFQRKRRYLQARRVQSAHGMASYCLTLFRLGGGGFSNPPPLRQNRDNSYTERAMTFEFSDFS